MKLLHEVEKAQIKKEVPQFGIGDTVRVHFRIVEGEKERIQVFEGVVIAHKGGESANARFTVRRVSFGEGVERVFPLHSPRVERVEVVREGHVRRAKLYYLRERAGKAARVKAKGRSASVAADATGRIAEPDEQAHASQEPQQDDVADAAPEKTDAEVADSPAEKPKQD